MALVIGCSADSGGSPPEPERVSTIHQALSSCQGDDLQYDHNAFAASLAIAIAQELGRWEVTTDFELSDAGLQLSDTGELRCQSGCDNVRALLRLQDDASAGIPGHDPELFRSKLAAWYEKQLQSLTQLVDEMLTVDKGVYRVRVQHSGKLMVAGESTWYSNRVEQREQVTQAGADEWRLFLVGTKHELVNVRSGKCLALGVDSDSDGVELVQRTCSHASTQQFEFARAGGNYAIRTKHYRALGVQNDSTSDGAAVIQIEWQGESLSQTWYFEPVGDGPHVDLNLVATAMYRLTFKHSGQALAVRHGSPAEGASIEQAAYSASDDRFHWFVTRVEEANQFINRRTGLCLALLEESPTSSLVQARCAADPLQLFRFAPTGNGHQVIYASTGRMLEIEEASSLEGARVVQSDGAWGDHRMLQLTPLLAGEPHRLTFSHVTNDGPCGDYYWYDIAQPNGEALRSPADSFVQLIFAGGKDSPTGDDENPFIAQRVDGNRVAIDPSGFMNGGSHSRSGGCLATDVLYDAEATLLGACCVGYDGSYGLFESSTWDANTFVCAEGSGDYAPTGGTNGTPEDDAGAASDAGLPVDATTRPDPARADDAGATPAGVERPNPGTSSTPPGGYSDLEGEPNLGAPPAGCSVTRSRPAHAPWALGLLLLTAGTRRRWRARGQRRAEPTPPRRAAT